jgi:hypothetical protein
MSKMAIAQNEIRLRALLSTGAKSPQELQQRLGVSQPTLSRLVSRLSKEVLTLGRARATRYALPRLVRGTVGTFPVYRVDEEGNAHPLGHLQALQPAQFWWEPVAGPGQLFADLPRFVQDMRPDGFMGRAFAHRHNAEMGLPQRLSDWKSEDVLMALSRRGEDIIGNLIVGEESLSRYFQATRQPLRLVSLDDRGREYLRFAQTAMAGEPPGSSAGGEQPKFTALLGNGSLRHVLVKFSFSTSTQEGRRWADLLICEHLALETIQEAGFPAAKSQIIEAGDRVFLEVQRFDRVGRFGRKPIVSLGAVDDEFFGRRDNWIAAAGRLEKGRMISREDAEVLRWLSVFGILISNTDQHFGNVSLIMREENRFSLAPAYDVLPMFYRPAGSEISARRFEVPIPPVGASLQWDDAREWAEVFWARAAMDERISPEFQSICGENKKELESTIKGPRLIS